MTEQEVRWIVEDAVVAGMDREVLDSLDEQKWLEIIENQRKWYLGLVGSEFSPTRQEKAQVLSKINSLRQFTFEGIEAELLRGNNFPGFYESSTPTKSQLENARFTQFFWNYSLEFAPSVLFSLSEVQKEITWDLAADPVDPWKHPGAATKDYDTDKRYDDLDDDFGDKPCVLYPAGEFFPLNMDQVDQIRSHEGAILDQVRVITPSQFKTLLLFDSSLVKTLTAELEK